MYKEREIYGKLTGEDIVQTDDFSFSYITLTPVDKREAKFYNLYRLYWIADIYWAQIAFNTVYVLFSMVRAILEEEEVWYKVIFAALVCELTIRCSGYCLRNFNWQIFELHLLVVNAIVYFVIFANFHIAHDQPQ